MRRVHRMGTEELGRAKHRVPYNSAYKEVTLTLVLNYWVNLALCAFH